MRWRDRWTDFWLVRGETAAVRQPNPTGLETEAADAVCTCVSGIPAASVVVGDQTVELLSLAGDLCPLPRRGQVARRWRNSRRAHATD